MLISPRKSLDFCCLEYVGTQTCIVHLVISIFKNNTSNITSITNQSLYMKLIENHLKLYTQNKFHNYTQMLSLLGHRQHPHHCASHRVYDPHGRGPCTHASTRLREWGWRQHGHPHHARQLHLYTEVLHHAEYEKGRREEFACANKVRARGYHSLFGVFVCYGKAWKVWHSELHFSKCGIWWFLSRSME